MLMKAFRDDMQTALSCVYVRTDSNFESYCVAQIQSSLTLGVNTVVVTHRRGFCDSFIQRSFMHSGKVLEGTLYETITKRRETRPAL